MSTAVAKTPAKKVKKPASALATTAVHGKAGSNHVVGIGNMRVIICKDGDDLWFAQGLEIDYAADGTSFDEVKKNFESGLCATIDLHIKAYGNLEKLLKLAPESAWIEFWKEGTRMRYSQISIHQDGRRKKAQNVLCFPSHFPFAGIDYLEPKAA